MEKERKIKTLSLVALIVAVLGLTVAFAALSQTLTINGTASVNSAEWDVHFENLSEPTITGNAKVIKNPTLNGTSITDLEVSLTKPGDSITYTFDVVNAGTINAENTKEFWNDIDLDLLDDESSEQFSVSYNDLIKNMYPKADYDGDGETSLEEQNKAFDNIFYITSGACSTGTKINSGKKAQCKLEIKYHEEAEELPKGDVLINIKEVFVYSQK